VAEEESGGAGGFFDFGDGASGDGGGAVKGVGEKVSVGGDYAEEIAEGVGDDLRFGEGKGAAFGLRRKKIEPKFFVVAKLGANVVEHRGEGVIEDWSGELIEREAAGSATGGSFAGKISDSGVVQSEKGKNGIAGADFFEVVKAAEFPCVDINDDGLEMAVRKSLKELAERIEAMYSKGNVRRVVERLREAIPGRVFPQEKNV
jgi:hypothetical protein